MAVRTAYVPVAGAVLTATNLAKMPGGWIGYNEVTTGQALTAAPPTDLTSLSLAVTVGTGRRIRISAVTRWNAAATGNIEVAINEGATQLNSAYGFYGSTASNLTLTPSVVLTPTPGAHTYKLVFVGTVLGGVTNLVASAVTPSYILVEDLGATP